MRDRFHDPSFMRHGFRGMSRTIAGLRSVIQPDCGAMERRREIAIFACVAFRRELLQHSIILQAVYFANTPPATDSHSCPTKRDIRITSWRPSNIMYWAMSSG